MRTQLHTERTVIGVLVAIPICVLIFLSNPPWDTSGAATAYYSILAFLCVTITASIANRIRIDPSAANNVLLAGIGYASITFAGAAIFYRLTGETPVIHTKSSGIFLNLVALAITGIIMALFATLNRSQHNNSKWESRSTSIAIIVISLAFFVGMMWIARQSISVIYFLAAGYIVGAIAISAFAFAAVMMYRNRKAVTSCDPFRMILSFIFFEGASINHILILAHPSSYWILSIIFMGLGLIIANIAISYPFFLDIGVHDNVAYGVSMITSLLAVIPFVLAQAIEVMIGGGVIIEVGATVLVHVGGAVLAGLSAYSLYAKLKIKSSPGQTAIIFLLLYWMISEMSIVITHFTPLYGFTSETQVSYIAGSIFSVITLIIAVRSVLNPTRFRYENVKRIVLFGLITPPIVIIFGEYMRLVIYSAFPEMQRGIFGPSIMLGMSYIALYALLTYILLLTAALGGELTFDSIGAALASVWVIVVILKANFGYGTAGWWVAESIIYLAIVFFAVLTVQMYHTVSKDSEKAIPAATAFSHIMSETIVQHQEKAIDILTELTKETQTSEKRLDLLASSLHEISKANELAKYIQAMVTENRFRDEDLESINLLNAITTAMSRLKMPEEKLKVKETTSLQAVYTWANSLLVEVFYYLFMGISKRIGLIDLIGIDIADIGIIPEKQLEVTFDIVIKSANVNVGLGLVKRYSEDYSMDVIEFAYSRRILSLFRGTMRWNTELISNQDILITVKMILPSVLETNAVK